MASVQITTVDYSDFHRWLPHWNGYTWFDAVDIPEATIAKIRMLPQPKRARPCGDRNGGKA